MWKLLLDIAFGYIRKNLLPKLNGIHPAHYALADMAMLMGEQVKEKLTDNDKNNKAQLEQLWDANCIEILSMGIRGTAALVKKDNMAKQKVLAILSEAIDDIIEDDAGAVQKMVASYELEQKALAIT